MLRIAEAHIPLASNQRPLFTTYEHKKYIQHMGKCPTKICPCSMAKLSVDRHDDWMDQISKLSYHFVA